MDLKTLLAPLQKFQTKGNLDFEITGLSYDSRKVEKGHLFAALPGVHFHGAQFIPNAEKAGAVAVLSDRAPETRLTSILVANPRLALAEMSNVFYDHPSNKLRLFGVTGTNGKTTSTFLMRSILEAASIRTGLLGTVQYASSAFSTPAQLTTPESVDLQSMLSQMWKDGSRACVMEASSHSLTLYRVAGCRYEAAIFTNLTQDHLDFHNTMEEYFQAKMMLFDNDTCESRIAIVNADDPYGARIIDARKKKDLSVATYGFDKNADYRVTSWNSTARGSEIEIARDDHVLRMSTPLIAKYNAYNIAGVVAAMSACGIQENAIVRGIEEMKQVPGRLERVDHGQPFLVLIDYAHTEDALRQLLATVRPYATNKLMVLFGCGGARDRGKRPLMGKAAAELADVVVLSSDNPRTEDPMQIIHEVQEGTRQTSNRNVIVLPDREEAIFHAVKIAEAGDALVLAGKGHENYQIIGTEKQHFDEREILEAALKRKV